MNIEETREKDAIAQQDQKEDKDLVPESSNIANEVHFFLPKNSYSKQAKKNKKKKKKKVIENADDQGSAPVDKPDNKMVVENNSGEEKAESNADGENQAAAKNKKKKSKELLRKHFLEQLNREEDCKARRSSETRRTGD